VGEIAVGVLDQQRDLKAEGRLEEGQRRLRVLLDQGGGQGRMSGHGDLLLQDRTIFNP
jgi:hypothetical protein